jgi:hypothetical protein
MNKKYERYIEYIVNDIEPPYFINMKEMYGLSEKEYEMVLSKIFNQPIIFEGLNVYNQDDIKIYHESSTGGTWRKWEYNQQGKLSYYVDSDGYIEDRR